MTHATPEQQMKAKRQQLVANNYTRRQYLSKQVVHWEIVGRDAGKLHSFYGDLFEWQIDANNPMHYGLVSNSHGVVGGIGQTDGAGHVMIYVGVDDPQAYLDRVEQLGGQTVMSVTTIPGMVTFAQFADPEGHVIGLVKREA